MIRPLKVNKFDKAKKFITPLKLKLITPLKANKFDKDSFLFGLINLENGLNNCNLHH